MTLYDQICIYFDLNKFKPSFGEARLWPFWSVRYDNGDIWYGNKKFSINSGDLMILHTSTGWTWGPQSPRYLFPKRRRSEGGNDVIAGGERWDVWDEVGNSHKCRQGSACCGRAACTRCRHAVSPPVLSSFYTFVRRAGTLREQGSCTIFTTLIDFSKEDKSSQFLISRHFRTINPKLARGNHRCYTAKKIRKLVQVFRKSSLKNVDI